MITASRLKELLRYSPKTGLFFWKVATSNRVFPGAVAGSIATKKGVQYLKIAIDGRDYDAGRLAWLYMTGELTTGRVDHADRDGLNNRWSNLRDATVGQNRANSTKVYGHLGVRGVRFYEGRSKPYHARLMKDGKLYLLGYHATLEEAKSAHDAKAKELWGAFYPMEAL